MTTANQIQVLALSGEVDEVTSLAPGEIGLRPGLLCPTRGPRTNLSCFIEAQGSYGIHAACTWLGDSGSSIRLIIYVLRTIITNGFGTSGAISILVPFEMVKCFWKL